MRNLISDLLRPVPFPTLHHSVEENATRLHLLGPLAYAAGYGQFRKDWVHAAIYADMRQSLVSEVVSVLVRNKVPVALLKGISYATSLYVDPAMRPMTDVDLLIPRKHHARGQELLSQLGYQRFGKGARSGDLHHAVTFRRGNSNIDLHRSIIQPLRSSVPLQEVWQRTQTAAERDDGALRLHPVDEALFHFAHMARHEFHVPFISYVDAARLLHRLNTVQRDELYTLARKSRLLRGVQRGIQLTLALQTCTHPVESTHPYSLLPCFRELLLLKPVWRPLQLVRKVALLDSPKQFAGLAVVAAAKQISLAKHRLYHSHGFDYPDR